MNDSKKTSAAPNRSFLAMTSRMMPATMSKRPAMMSMTAPMSVGNRATMPVCMKSMPTEMVRINPMMPRRSPNPPKNGSGLYSRIIRKMVLMTLMPSPTVSSLKIKLLWCFRVGLMPADLRIYGGGETLLERMGVREYSFLNTFCWYFWDSLF